MDKQYRKPTNSHVVQNHHVENSKYNIKIFMTEKPGRSTNKQKEINNCENNLYAFKQNNVSVKQDLYEIKRRIFANFCNNVTYKWNASCQNSEVLPFQSFFIREMNVYELWILRCNVERHLISKSLSRKLLNSVVEVSNELKSNDFSKIRLSLNHFIFDSMMGPVARTEVDESNNPEKVMTISTKIEEQSTKQLESKHNCINSFFDSELVLSLSDSTESIIDEKRLDIFLLEEEFDDDTIILQNMSKNGDMDLVCASQQLSLPPDQPLSLNDDFRSDYFSSDQSASSIYSNSSSDNPGDDGFLAAIMNLNSRLGELIKGCRSMNSELKGISRDMQTKRKLLTI